MSKHKNVTVCRNREYPLLSDKMVAFKKKTGLDDSFNRNGCWDKAQESRYMTSVITGQAPSKIIVANIEDCLEQTIPDGIDHQYFTRWANAGFDKIAVDGNNRTVTLDKYLAGEVKIAHGEYHINGNSFMINASNDNFKTHPKALKDHIRDNVTIAICEYVVAKRSDLSELFININDGFKLSDQELRNAILVPFADHIRNLASEYTPKLKCIFKKGNFRLKVDEQMVLLAVYNTFGVNTSISKKVKDNAYLDNSTVWINFWNEGGKKNIEETLSLVGKYADAGFKDVSMLLNLHMLVCHINKLKVKILDKEKFFKWFMRTENARWANQKILFEHKKRGEARNYASCCSVANSETMSARLELILTDFRKIESDVVTEIDPERLFARQQRYQMWERQEGKCPRTGKIIPEDEINNHDLWAADHVIPYSLGGETTIENGELVCREYNQKKGAKVNYKMAA
jgi:hypothetical protein